MRVPLTKSITLREETIAGVDCLWVSNEHSTDGRVILYFHGGGLISGSVLTHRGLAADLAVTVGLPVLLVGYRLLPEHKYPAPLEDVLLVYRTLIAEKRFAHDEVVLGGDSSGGGLALAALVHLRDSGDPMPSKAFMVSGAFDMTLSGESMQTNAGKEPHLTPEGLLDWREQYLDDVESPLLSPYFADLSGLPPLLLLAGGKDLWLSDSGRVAQKVAAYGGEAQLRIWGSMVHVWVMDAGLTETKEAMRAIRAFVLGEGATE